MEVPGVEVPGWPDSRCGEGKAEFMKKHSTIVQKTQLPARLRPAARTPSRVARPVEAAPSHARSPALSPRLTPGSFPSRFPRLGLQDRGPDRRSPFLCALPSLPSEVA